MQTWSRGSEVTLPAGEPSKYPGTADFISTGMGEGVTEASSVIPEAWDASVSQRKVCTWPRQGACERGAEASLQTPETWRY